MFHPPRDRDAYPAIRGYVYQIDCTVKRWLTLQPGQLLELERGEDIDLVGRMVSAGETTEIEDRLLGQIKHREATITLRTPAGLEALANFYDHRINNVGAELRFCFVTNAVAGCERRNPFPDRIPGITLWEQVRTRQLTETETASAVKHLRQFLERSLRPDGFAESVWAQWREFLATATPEVFKEFIEQFEWSIGQPDARQLTIALRHEILALGFARGDAEASAVADRLFVFVARMLGTAGLKRLTVEERTHQLAAPTLPEEERNQLAQLRTAVAEHSYRIDKLEAGLTSLGNQVEKHFLANTAAGRVELSVPAFDFSLPPPVSRLCPRRQTVDSLCRDVSSSSWLAIHGGPNVGKSQLALQVAEVHANCRGWVRFDHAESTVDFGFRLEAALFALAGWSHALQPTGWYAEALAAVGPGSLLVLDDLPRLVGDEPLVERLVQFGHAARAAGVCVMSTSQFELPVRLRHNLGDWLNERAAPAFTDSEAGDLFRAHGAPDTVLSERHLHFLNSLAAGHPLLLTSTAEFLAARAWQYREEEIDALLRGDHAQTILPEVVERLTRTLGDAPREFLYRLTLPLGSFDQADMIALANVVPSVDRPRERLNELLGAWVQRDTDTRYAVSPLAKPLGRSELAAGVRANCFHALAELITGRGAMSIDQGHRAILYNMEAGESGRATTLYVLLLLQALKWKRAKQVVPYISLWRETVLPADLSVGHRLFVRAYQLAAFSKYEFQTEFVVHDIDNLLDQATGRDGWGILALAVQNLGRFRTKDPARVLHYVRRALELPAIHGADGSEIVFEEIWLPDMLWMLVTDLRTPALLHAWLDAIEALPERHRTRFWESEVARQGVWLVPNAVYLAECEKPRQSQDWDEVLRELVNLLQHARRFKEPRLEATITGAILDILGERKRLGDTPTVADETLVRWPNNPDVTFEVKGTLGRLYAFHKDRDVALDLLDEALSEPQSRRDHERLRCLLAANTCVDDQDLRYIEEARHLVHSSVEIPDIEAARALGECSLSVYLATGGQSGAFAAFASWDVAMRRFLDVPRKDRLWRDLFPLFGHATRFLFEMAREGVPPDQAYDGSPYIAPSRGFLMKDYMPEREKHYRKGSEASVAMMMGSFATAAGAREEAAHWVHLAIEESRRAGASFVQVAMGQEAIVEMVCAGQLEDAVEMGVFVGRGMVTHRAIASTSTGNYEGVGVDLNAAFNKLSEEERQRGDYFAVITGLLPAAIALVHLSVESPGVATDLSKRLGLLCRELAEDELGDRQLWQTAAELFELSATGANARQVIAHTRAVNDDERANAVRAIGYLLATWQASPDEAITCQLSIIELVFRLYSAEGPVRRRILMPYIEAYWRHVAQERRFTFRAPELTVASIQSALAAPEPDRIHAILSAAANGLQVRGAHEVLQRIRAT